jgi:hypothetical protein
VSADLNVYDMSHAGYLFVQDAPESREVFAELDLFLRQHLSVEDEVADPGFRTKHSLGHGFSRAPQA